ncbi:hypothetical protein IE53DRAFT_371320 [Violaceomyces palustris]|uniref:Uncharacterized protein n=1 Tax=Violaceomyces palustris TaxID=1673888 RepID=A0ACD0NP54_9BASI|nr:hypothetical protein IE53DRAFT_371320 [Violaceomyces palustris]
MVVVVSKPFAHVGAIHPGTRALLTFHHILSSAKISSLHDWSLQDGLCGIIKTGYPGVVIVAPCPEESRSNSHPRSRGVKTKGMKPTTPAVHSEAEAKETGSQSRIDSRDATGWQDPVSEYVRKVKRLRWQTVSLRNLSSLDGTVQAESLQKALGRFATTPSGSRRDPKSGSGKGDGGARFKGLLRVESMKEVSSRSSRVSGILA